MSQDPGWRQSSGGFQTKVWKKPTCSLSIHQPGSKLGIPRRTPHLLAPLSVDIDSGSAFFLDIRFSCSADVSWNRKMNQINILDMQTRTDLACQPLFWISNQENDTRNHQLGSQHSRGGGQNSRMQNKHPLTF